MDIEIWFDEIDAEDEIEYPLIRSGLHQQIKKLMLDKPDSL